MTAIAQKRHDNNSTAKPSSADTKTAVTTSAAQSTAQRPSRSRPIAAPDQRIILAQSSARSPAGL